MSFEAAFTSGPADMGEELHRYDGGLAAGPPSPFQAARFRVAPPCRCRHHWWTLFRGHRRGGICVRCGGDARV